MIYLTLITRIMPRCALPEMSGVCGHAGGKPPTRKQSHRIPDGSAVYKPAQSLSVAWTPGQLMHTLL